MAKEIRTVIAYAANDSSDRKEIAIPDGARYVNHGTRITTANPNDPHTHDDWWYVDGVTRGGPGDRIQAVYVQVHAGPKLLFGGARWIGVELAVEIEWL